jgi:hypothetical protein
VRSVEQTAAEGDSFQIRRGAGIEVENQRVLVTFENETKLIGEIRELSADAGLVIDLTENATPALVQRLARRITFGSTVQELVEGDQRLVEFKIKDGDGGSGSDVKKVELIFQPDDDLDGVDDGVEDDAPFEGDGNQDGVRDSEQGHVASLRGQRDRFITIASPEGTRLVDVRPMENPNPNELPADTEFPVGFFDFDVKDVDSQETTMVTVQLEPGTTANSYYMFGPTPDDPNPHLYPFLFDGETGAKIFADRIEVYFRDGQQGDSDLTANGVITDPAAPALTEFPWQNPIDIGDVNFDRKVSALDALVILNDLRINQQRSLPLVPTGTEQLASSFLDVSGDNKASVLDALRVINLLAQNALKTAAENEIMPAVADTILIAPPASIANDDDDERRIWDEAIMGIADSLKDA